MNKLILLSLFLFMVGCKKYEHVMQYNFGKVTCREIDHATVCEIKTEHSRFCVLRLESPNMVVAPCAIFDEMVK